MHQYFDRAERHDLWITIFATHSPFLLFSFVEENKQSRDQNSYLSARYFFLFSFTISLKSLHVKTEPEYVFFFQL